MNDHTRIVDKVKNSYNKSRASCYNMMTSTITFLVLFISFHFSPIRSRYFCNTFQFQEEKEMAQSGRRRNKCSPHNSCYFHEIQCTILQTFHICKGGKSQKLLGHDIPTLHSSFLGQHQSRCGNGQHNLVLLGYLSQPWPIRLLLLYHHLSFSWWW